MEVNEWRVSVLKGSLEEEEEEEEVKEDKEAVANPALSKKQGKDKCRKRIINKKKIII